MKRLKITLLLTWMMLCACTPWQIAGVSHKRWKELQQESLNYQAEKFYREENQSRD